MAIACFGLVIVWPLPLFNFPSCMAFISRSTLLLAAGLYFRDEVFFAGAFFAELFFVAICNYLRCN